MTFKEKEKLLAAAPDHIRVLVILILDTSLRSGKEALALKWEDVDFANESIRIRKSKTLAGIRRRNLLWPEFSEYVFANPQRPATHLGMSAELGRRP